MGEWVESGVILMGSRIRGKFEEIVAVILISGAGLTMMEELSLLPLSEFCP